VVGDGYGAPLVGADDSRWFGGAYVTFNAGGWQRVTGARLAWSGTGTVPVEQAEVSVVTVGCWVWGAVALVTLL